MTSADGPVKKLLQQGPQNNSVFWASLAGLLQVALAVSAGVIAYWQVTEQWAVQNGASLDRISLQAGEGGTIVLKGAILLAAVLRRDEHHARRRLGRELLAQQLEPRRLALHPE